MDAIGLSGHETATYLNNLWPTRSSPLAAYLIFGGGKLFVRGGPTGGDAPTSTDVEPFDTSRTGMTLAMIAMLVARRDRPQRLQVGMAAFTGASILSLLAPPTRKRRSRRCRGASILMVCGVTVLIGVCSADRRHGALHRHAREDRDAGHGDSS